MMRSEELLSKLKTKSSTLAVAESCTGGMISAAITDIPGASAVYRGGVVAYDDEVKIKVLGLDPSILESEGAVSEATVTAMARSVREVIGADLGVAVSGIAGPSGGSEEKPVGLVFIAASDGRHTICERRRFPGGRDEVRKAAAEQAFAVAIEVLELE